MITLREGAIRGDRQSESCGPDATSSGVEDGAKDAASGALARGGSGDPDPPCIGSNPSFSRERSSVDPASPWVSSLEIVKSGAPHRPVATPAGVWSDVCPGLGGPRPIRFGGSTSGCVWRGQGGLPSDPVTRGRVGDAERELRKVVMCRSCKVGATPRRSTKRAASLSTHRRCTRAGLVGGDTGEPLEGTFISSVAGMGSWAGIALCGVVSVE
jgi:hypothetical protein